MGTVRLIRLVLLVMAGVAIIDTSLQKPLDADLIAARAIAVTALYKVTNPKEE